MVRGIRIVTSFTIMLLILGSLLAIIIPISSARQTIFDCQTIVQIEYDEDAANSPFLPVDMTKEIPVTINYYIRGYFDEEVPLAYEHLENNFIYLDIIEKPEWCTASLSPDFLLMFPSASGEIENVTLIVKVDENVHAFDIGTIKIEVRVQDMRVIKGGTFNGEISFNPGYLPLLDLNVPSDTVKMIGPLDTAKFDIDIENLGNAKTIVSSNVLDIPDGWIVTIESETVIGTITIGDSPNRRISLIVRPPYDFGYHNDREVIQVSLTPSYFEDPALAGEEYLLTFIVQSKGFSTPGFEAVFVIIALIGVAVIAKKTKLKSGKGGSDA